MPGYNLPTMLRWFITVFTLHFFLSVGVSAVGVAKPLGAELTAGSGPSVTASLDESVLQHPTLVAVADTPAHAPSDAVPDMPGHALADDLHDLPDELTPPTAVLRQPGESYPPLQVDQSRSALHAPATPRKPPRAGLFA